MCVLLWYERGKKGTKLKEREKYGNGRYNNNKNSYNDNYNQIEKKCAKKAGG